jgi:hypothetical protein
MCFIDSALAPFRDDRVRVGVGKNIIEVRILRSPLTPKGESTAQFTSICFIDSALAPFRDDRVRAGVGKISLGFALGKSH